MINEDTEYVTEIIYKSTFVTYLYNYLCKTIKIIISAFKIVNFCKFWLSNLWKLPRAGTFCAKDVENMQ